MFGKVLNTPLLSNLLMQHMSECGKQRIHKFLRVNVTLSKIMHIIFSEPSLKRGSGDWEWGWEWKYYFGWKSLSAFSKLYSIRVQGNFHLKVHLHNLIPSFTDWITQSVKKRMCLYLEILNTFFVGNLFWSCII